MSQDPGNKPRMVNCCRIWLGIRGELAREAYRSNYIGVDSIDSLDLSDYLGLSILEFQESLLDSYRECDERWQRKNRKNVVTRSTNMIRGKLSTLYRFFNEMIEDDLVLCPDLNGNYVVGVIGQGYHYVKDSALPHRLGVIWRTRVLTSEDLDEYLRKAIHTSRTLVSLRRARAKLLELIERHPKKSLVHEEPFGAPVFDFLADYKKALFVHLGGEPLPDDPLGPERGGWVLRREFSFGGGRIDTLAINKYRLEIVIFVLKRNTATSSALGEILGYISMLRANPNYRRYTVRGAIVALNAGERLKCALGFNYDVAFYRYEKEPFKLIKYKPR